MKPRPPDAKSPPTPRLRRRTRPVEYRDVPAGIATPLQGLATRHTAVRLARGVTGLVLIGVALGLGQLVLDRALDFPRSVRACLLVIDLAVVVHFARRQVIAPWRLRWGVADAAFALQRQWKALGSRLICAVELAGSATAGHGSPQLAALLINDASAMLDGLPIKTVVPWQPVAKRAGLAVLAVAAALALGVSQQPLTALLLRRAALSDAPLPTATQVVSETGNLRIVEGASVEFAARATGVLPAQGRLELAFAGGEHRTVLVRPSNEDPARFVFALNNVQQAGTYRFFLGDGRGPIFSITPLPAPLLQEITFRQTFPAYTRRAALTQPAGALTLFAGSQVEIVARSNAALSAGSVRFAGTTPSADVALTVEGAGARNLRGTFTVPAEGLSGLSLPITSADGITATNTTVYPVQLTTDAAPIVSLSAPTAARVTLVPTARLELRGRVSDDFDVATAELVWESPLTGTTRVPLTIGPDGAISTDFVPAREAPTLAAGASIAWWIEATDHNDVTGPGIGRTDRRELVLVTLAAKRQEMLQRLQETSRQLEDVARRQGDVREDLGEALRRSTPTP